MIVNMGRHKHLVLDQRKLDRARRFFGVKTESAAVERALDLALTEAAIVKAMDEVGGGGFVYHDVFGEMAEIERRRKRVRK
jgi:hypothetical protein